MNRAGIQILVAACVLTCSGIATAAGSGTGGDTFLKDAIQGNLGEVQVGKLAQQKGMSQDVKDFGATLEKDHGAANSKAMAAAEAVGMTAPTEPGPEQKKMYQELTKLSGKEFDQHFAREMVKDHEKDIKKYTAEAGKGDGQASTYAQQTLPALRKHLAMAEKLESGKSSTASSSSH